MLPGSSGGDRQADGVDEVVHPGSPVVFVGEAVGETAPVIFLVLRLGLQEREPFIDAFGAGLRVFQRLIGEGAKTEFGVGFEQTARIGGALNEQLVDPVEPVEISAACTDNPLPVRRRFSALSSRCDVPSAASRAAERQGQGNTEPERAPSSPRAVSSQIRELPPSSTLKSSASSVSMSSHNPMGTSMRIRRAESPNSSHSVVTSSKTAAPQILPSAIPIAAGVPVYTDVVPHLVSRSLFREVCDDARGKINSCNWNEQWRA